MKSKYLGLLVLVGGCAVQPAPVASKVAALQVCLFGETFYDTQTVAQGLDVQAPVELTATSALNDLLEQQIIAAVHVSSHTDVQTAADAFTRVDDGVINVYRLHETATGRDFVALEYGAGDNSYGAIFVDGSTTIAAKIEDGDLYECNVMVERDDTVPRIDVNDTHRLHEYLKSLVEKHEGTKDLEVYLDDASPACSISRSLQQLTCDVDYLQDRWNGTMHATFQVQNYEIVKLESLDFDGNF